jgi:hypothetical protein
LGPLATQKLHQRRSGLVAQESADQVDLHDLGEEVTGHRSISAQHAAGADHSGAVHQQVDATHGGGSGFHRSVDLGFGGHIAALEAGASSLATLDATLAKNALRCKLQAPFR